MTSLATLKSAVQKAFRQISRIKEIREVEVFASSTDQLLCRLNYTSGIPCHGVEEPKSSESFGIGIRAVFTGQDGPRIGFGSESRDLSAAGIRRALEKARQNAVPDADLVSLPAPFKNGHDRKAARLTRYHDNAIMNVKDDTLVETGWRVVSEALKAFSGSEAVSSAERSKATASLGLIVGGDVSLVRQRVAIASSHLPKVQTDESTFITSYVTSMVERRQAKGSGYAATTHLKKFKGEAGSEAAKNALRATGGQRVLSGRYTVILGPQPVSDLLVNLILPSLSADAFFSGRSAFLGDVSRTVASSMLSIYDQGAGRGLVGSRAMTCEGLPTGRTDLIKNGVLSGLLSNHYETQRLLRDPNGRDKLGVTPQEFAHGLVPRNGFRLSARGGRQYDVQPTIAATNVFVEGNEPHTTDSLLRTVENGLYIGRIWYTYAINGLRAGDFTCTVVGDSYLIRGGRLAAPLQPNTVRITGNIRHLLKNIIGVTKQSRPIVGWSADEVIYAPDIAVRDVQISDIAQYMESV